MILIFRKVEPNISCLNVSRSDLFFYKTYILYFYKIYKNYYC